MDNKTLNLEDYLSKFEDVEVSKLVPLIKWDYNWPIPKEIQIEEYTVTKKFKGQNKSILRYRLLGKLEGNNQKPTAKRWYKGDKDRHGLGYIYKENCVWLVLKSNLTTQINLTNTTLLFEDGWLKLKVPDDFVGVWFKYGRGRINFTIILKIMVLNELFWETFGILYGEMLRKGQQIAIANTEPVLINHVLNFFDKSRIIPKESWNITLAINGKNIPIEKRDKILKLAKEYWKKEVDIPDVSIKNVYWYPWKSTIRPNYGEMDIRFYNLSLKKVIDHLFDFVEKKSLNDKNHTLPFLRGLMAAEGGVDYVNGNIRTIRLASSSKKERELYHKLFEMIGIKAKLYEGRHNIVVNGITNFIKCKKLDIFRLHTKKNKAFNEAFNNSLSVRLYLLLKNSTLTKDEIVKKLNIKNTHELNRVLMSLMQIGYIKKKNRLFLRSKSIRESWGN